MSKSNNKKNIEVIKAEITKLSLQPGDVLHVNLTSPGIRAQDVRRYGEELRDIFPNNEVVVVCGDDLKVDMKILQGAPNEQE